MDIKKLKKCTGITSIISIVAVAFFVFFSLWYAGQNSEGLGMIGVVAVFIIFGLILSGIIVLQLVMAILYLKLKPKKRTFYIVGCVLSVFDVAALAMTVIFAVTIFAETGGFLIPLISALCVLPQVAQVTLKILCAVRFKPEYAAL